MPKFSAFSINCRMVKALCNALGSTGFHASLLPPWLIVESSLLHAIEDRAGP